MADDTFDKVGAALGNRLDSALKGFMQDVMDIAAGQKDISSLSVGDATTFNVDELRGFLEQLGGADFGFAFRSASPKLQGTLLRPAVITPSGMTPADALKTMGIGGSISIVGTINF